MVPCRAFQYAFNAAPPRNALLQLLFSQSGFIIDKHECGTRHVVKVPRSIVGRGHSVRLFNLFGLGNQ